MNPSIESLLQRPVDQRLREYKYRCAQSIVFGLPVVFLQYFGRRIGGPEADRWVAVLQALLAGWTLYVGAAGMLFEGILLLGRRVTGDFIVAAAALLAYALSLISTVLLLVTGQARGWGRWYHAVVITIALWTGVQWLRLKARRSRSPEPTPRAK